MHAIQIHIDETLSVKQLEQLKSTLMSIPHITDVVVSNREPHDFMVEYEEKYNAPIEVMHELHNQGLHPDIISA